MKEVVKKLYQIQTEIKGLSKGTQAFNYKYVSGDKILHEVRPRMDALGLVLLPEVVEVKNAPVSYSTPNKRGDALVTTTEILTTVKMKFTWVDVESGDTLEVEWAGNGCNKFDKGFGSALTYGERYYLLKLFHIATDADDVDYVSIERDKQIEDAMEADAEQWKEKQMADFQNMSRGLDRGFDPFL